MGAKGKMYKADVAAFIPGSPPMEAAGLGVENIGAFVLSYPFIKNTHMTHPYGITKAPDGSFISRMPLPMPCWPQQNGYLYYVAEVPAFPTLCHWRTGCRKCATGVIVQMVTCWSVPCWVFLFLLVRR